SSLVTIPWLYTDSRSPPGVALPRAPSGVALPTSFASLPIVVHPPKQLLDVLHACHHTRYGAGSGEPLELILLESSRLAAWSLDLQGQRPAPIHPDQVGQAPPVRSTVGFDHVRALAPQPAHDGLGDGRFGHRTPLPAAASRHSRNSRNRSRNTETRFPWAFPAFVPTFRLIFAKHHV